MPLYEYRCPQCDTRTTSTTRADRVTRVCLSCGYSGPHQRVFSFSFKPLLHSHFNHTTGTMISDMKQMRSELSRASDAATEQTGIPHNFQPLEPGDHAASGATNEGIAESNAIRRAQGMRELPVIPD